MSTSIILWAIGVVVAALVILGWSSVRRVLREFRHDLWSTNELADAKEKLWDIRLKIIAGVGFIAGAFWAVFSYNTTAEQELRKSFWEKQITLYFDAAQTTSEIATLPSADPNRQIAITKFWQLYFGQLRVVEDDANVGSAMDAFGQCLTQPGNSQPGSPCDKGELQQRALQLAVSCRLSIAADWDRKLKGLTKL
jgi:hypothetical protein